MSDLFSIKRRGVVIASCILFFGALTGKSASDAALETVNLARGAEVTLVPLPNGAAGSDRLKAISQSLTDGEVSRARNNEIWRDPKVPLWSYQPQINLVVDLQKTCHIQEIAIRLLGGTGPGSGQGKSFPVEVEVFTSENGEDYFKVATFSRWNRGDFAKFGVPRDEGKTWVHNLKFENLNAVGRWVGFRVHGTGMTATDEITVLGSAGKPDEKSKPGGERSGFTIKSPQFYFHKPYLEVATNVSLPVPLGLSTATGARQDRLTFNLDLPAGLELRGGNLGKLKLKDLTPEMLADGGKRYKATITHELHDPSWNNRSHFGRLYLQASGWGDGQAGALTYQFGDGVSWESPAIKVPVKAVKVVPAPRLKKMMAGQGWWYLHEMLDWPDALENYRVLGLNTVSLTVGQSPSLGSATPEMRLLEEARKKGFYISTVDSTLFRLVQRHKADKEIYCQFGDGQTGKAFCPSYRGKYWDEEVHRFSTMMATIRPNFSSQDIEVWKAADRLDFDFSHQAKETRKCLRCEEDFKASGLKDSSTWRRAKGLELWRELMTSARRAVSEAGGPDFRASGYNFRPNQTYQEVWNFDMLMKAGLLDHSQVSNYNCLYPAHIASIGDRIRQDRQKLPSHGSVMPWLTPGDAGDFPGECFRWALLEAYTNGASGIWFYSNRNWDGESFIAYNEAVRAISSVEDIVTEGQLAGGALKIEGAGRISGMKLGDRMVLLVADYFEESGGRLTVQIDVPKRSSLVDLSSGIEVVHLLPVGPNTLNIPLEGQRARILALVPHEN